jgi:very-short-patch-repair endonuclease
MDTKTLYLYKTLSRTKRKDCENYVINAIWNRLDNVQIKPVTQQYVYDTIKQKRYFIDLYFPQIHVGIEIDEGHHEFQKQYDVSRGEAIWLEINKITVDGTSGYTQERIQVYNQSFDEIEERINNVVQKLKQKIDSTSIKPWIIDLHAYINNLQMISTDDDLTFTAISQICNMLFQANYKEIQGGSRKSYFLPTVLYRDPRFHHTKLWFLKLAVEEDGILTSVSQHWNNRLNLDGSIIEFKETTLESAYEGYEELVHYDGPDRYAFARSTDPFGLTGYRFIGKYRYTKKVAIQHQGMYVKAYHYQRIANECPIIKND